MPSEDRRQHLRAEIPRARLRCRNGSEFEDQMLLDLSAGGAFVRTSETLPVGSVVEVELLVGDSLEAAQARGRVTRIQVGAQPSGDGMALEFEGLAREVTTELERVVAEVRVRSAEDRAAQAAGRRPPAPGPADDLVAPSPIATDEGDFLEIEFLRRRVRELEAELESEVENRRRAEVPEQVSAQPADESSAHDSESVAPEAPPPQEASPPTETSQSPEAVRPELNQPSQTEQRQKEADAGGWPDEEIVFADEEIDLEPPAASGLTDGVFGGETAPEAQPGLEACEASEPLPNPSQALSSSEPSSDGANVPKGPSGPNGDRLLASKDASREELHDHLLNGARIVTTQRFQRLEPVARGDIQVSDWLAEADDLMGLQQLAKGRMSEDQLIEVLHVFFQRELISIST